MIDKRKFWENGYSIEKNFFREEEVSNIKTKAMYLFRLQLVATGLLNKADAKLSEGNFNELLFELFRLHPERIITTGKHIQHMIDLHRVSLDKRIEDGLKDIGLSFPNVCTRPMLFFNARKLAKKDVYWKTSPHQDWRSMQGSLNSIVVWLPLVPVTKLLGALEIVPKSHLFGLKTTNFEDGFGTIPDEEVQKYDWESIELDLGDVLFFSSMLFHRSGDNSTDNGIRWSCHFRYNDMKEEDFINRGFPHPYVYYPNPDVITPNYPTQKDIELTYRVG